MEFIVFMFEAICSQAMFKGSSVETKGEKT
jgi:hypothetical protein